MTMSFEFLSSFPEWESSCLLNAVMVDSLPVSRGWTERAQLLNTLAGYKGDAYNKLESVAKNGRAARGHNAAVRGFPGLLKDGFDRQAPVQWLSLRAPSPEQMAALPTGSTLLRVDVELLSPFFSKDDTAFYPTDNVLRRDKVFELPFLSAAGIKGLLRWAHRMATGAIDDDDAARFLFGVASDGEDDSHQGALHLWPLIWHDCRIGQDIINPQHRDTGAGTVPVKYEVVKAGGKGTLWLMLVPPLGDAEGVRRFLPDLLRDLQWLVEKGGLSAKQTSGWGAVKVLACNACIVGVEPCGGAGNDASEAVWKSVMTDDGQLKPYSQQVFTTGVFVSLLQELEGWSASRIKKENKNNNISAVYAEVQKLFEQKFCDSGDKEAGPDWYWPEKGQPKSLAVLQLDLLAVMKEEKTHG